MDLLVAGIWMMIIFKILSICIVPTAIGKERGPLTAGPVVISTIYGGITIAILIGVLSYIG
jgi:hypothetical protein